MFQMSLASQNVITNIIHNLICNVNVNYIKKKNHYIITSSVIYMYCWTLNKRNEGTSGYDTGRFSKNTHVACVMNGYVKSTMIDL